jgi:hypothetical protein
VSGAARLVVVLSPENSGSTLVTAILGGSPQVLAPPELHLFRYADYDTWRRRQPEALASLRWLLASLGLPQEDAPERFAGHSIDAVYRELLRLAGPARLLVDKTPAYARDGAVLRRIEALAPHYVWLLRHPLGVLASNIERRASRQALRRQHARTPLGRRAVDLVRAWDAAWHLRRGFARRRLAYWLDLHARIEDFLAGIPAQRRSRLVFERLVRSPRPEILRLCAELGIGFDASMLEPRRNLPGAIRWGLGSEKAAGHAGIDARVADRWRETLDEGLLSAELRRALERLDLASA